MHLQIFGRGGERAAAALPSARTEGLEIQEIEDEAAIYDLDTHEIHHLNPTALAVWRLSDGTRAAHQIGPIASSLVGDMVDDQAVRLAWTLLSDRRLLREPLAPELRVERTSRRSFLKGALATGAATLPAIVSISAPKAAAAASQGCGGRDANCYSDADCCDGYHCNGGYIGVPGGCQYG